MLKRALLWYLLIFLLIVVVGIAVAATGDQQFGTSIISNAAYYMFWFPIEQVVRGIGSATARSRGNFASEQDFVNLLQWVVAIGLLIAFVYWRVSSKKKAKNKHEPTLLEKLMGGSH